jgi:predicted kinase
MFTNEEKNLIVCVGCIGSGKSTFSKEFKEGGDFRVSQDEQGRVGHYEEFLGAIKIGFPRVIIDRMNFNKQQRAKYIEPARKMGYAITIVEFKTCPLICRERALNRQGHPTIGPNQPELVDKIIKFYHEAYEEPTIDEYDNYNIFQGEEA